MHALNILGNIYTHFYLRHFTLTSKEHPYNPKTISSQFNSVLCKVDSKGTYDQLNLQPTLHNEKSQNC